MSTHHPQPAGASTPHGPAGLPPQEDDVEVDVDNDPGNEDPGSQFDRDATVPLLESDE